MEQKLEIKKEILEHGIELIIFGRIDAYGAEQLSRSINEVIHTGIYNIILNMANVPYISSAGIRILIQTHKKLISLNGSFRLSSISDNIKSILEMVGVESLITSAKIEKSLSPEMKEEESVKQEGFSFSLKEVNAQALLKLKIVGNPELIKTSEFTEQDCFTETLSKNKLAIGLGAIGSDFNDCKNRFGELIAIAGTAAYLPSDGTNKPDYVIAAGKYIPEIKLLYGIVCDGEFSHILNFKADMTKGGIKLSVLIDTIREKINWEKIGIIMIGETAGLVGAYLLKSPFLKEKGSSPFVYPAIKESIDFSTERNYPNMLSVIAGIASESPTGELSRITKPLASNSKTWGHFHCAIFPFRPIKKDVSDISGIINPLFEDEQLKSVIHLINDERDITGVGQSEFIQGTCWIGRIR